MADLTGWQPSFDGMALAELDAGSSGIERAALETMRALDGAGLLTQRHALSCQLILELARAVGRGLAYGKVTVATATLARQLLEAIDTLPVPPADDDAANAFADLAATLGKL